MFNRISHIVKIIFIAISCVFLFLSFSTVLLEYELEEDVQESIELIINIEKKVTQVQSKTLLKSKETPKLFVEEGLFYQPIAFTKLKIPLYLLYNRWQIDQL